MEEGRCEGLLVVRTDSLDKVEQFYIRYAFSVEGDGTGVEQGAVYPCKLNDRVLCLQLPAM